MQDAYREALVEEDILPLSNADVEVVQAEEGKPLIFKATVPVRPEVALGDYKHFNFKPEIETIDDAACRPGRRGAARPERDTRRGRGSRREGRRLCRHLVRRHAGRPAVRGRDVRADAADPRPGAADPGLRDEPRRAQGRRHDRVRRHVPRGLPGGRVWPASRRTSASSSRSFARRSCPTSTTTSSRASATSIRSARCAADISSRLERNALDRARHEFADRIIEYAVANATVELPEVLVDQEVEVMHDEFRGSLARQGITEEAYLKAVEKTERGPPRRVPAERREARQDAARPVQGGRRRGRRGPRRGGRGRGRAGRERYAGDARLARVLRVRPRPVVHPQHAAPKPGRRGADRRMARRRIPSTRRCRTSRTSQASASATRARTRTPPSMRRTRAP